MYAEKFVRDCVIATFGCHYNCRSAVSNFNCCAPQMLLPPKYEDVIAMPASSSAAAMAGAQPPPAYSED